MKERLEQLLKTIVDEYVVSAAPVASLFLAQKMPDAPSSATIRNDMAELESAGYIAQPHTSAGRIPTTLGYQYYVEHFVDNIGLKKNVQKQIDLLMSSTSDRRDVLKTLARVISELTNEAVILAFEKNDIYYTGLSELFSKPEFSQQNLVVDVSRVIDSLEPVVQKMFDSVAETKVLLGDQCPFGAVCGSVVTSFDFQKHGRVLISVVGPLRMDYNFNFNLLNYIENK
jgi:transcriptional regulator of heat shock response